MLKYGKLSKNKRGWAGGRISADTGTTSYFYWVISNTQVKIQLLYTLKHLFIYFPNHYLYIQPRKENVIYSTGRGKLRQRCSGSGSKLLLGYDQISKSA